MNVVSEIHVYEVDGRDMPPGKSMKIRVLSHWNKQEFIVLEVGEQKVTVAAPQLEAAVANARNVRR